MATQASTTQASAQRLSGVDVSYYQGKVAWKTVQDAGISFVYLKATEGLHTIDPRYLSNTAQLDKLKIPYGLYYFFEPKEKGFKQANHFLENVKVSGRLPPVLDVELSKGVKIAKIKVEVKQDIEHLEKCLAQGYPILFDLVLFESFDNAGVKETGIVPMPHSLKDNSVGMMSDGLFVKGQVNFIVKFLRGMIKFFLLFELYIYCRCYSSLYYPAFNK